MQMPTRPTKPAQSKGLRFHRFYTQELAVLVFWIVVVAAVAVVISRAEARPAMFFTVTAAMLATVLVTRVLCEGAAILFQVHERLEELCKFQREARAAALKQAEAARIQAVREGGQSLSG